MQNPGATFHFVPDRSPVQRYAGWAFVGLIHVVLIYALVTGLAVRIVQQVPKALEAHMIETRPQTPHETLPVPAKPTLATPDTDTIPPPQIEIATPPANAIAAKTAEAPPAPDMAASARGTTHTIPPYPPMARRLGHQGVVQLRLTITPDGRVAQAEIVKSSGWPELDQEAAEWVRAHWRYKPAVQAGVLVASVAMAAVKFDLRAAD